MPLSAGDHLGPYEILEPIGRGGMGEVWKARDTRLDRIVAIKRLIGEHSARFQQEARAIAALNHPHICQIYDVGPDYLVLEYVEGTQVKGPMEQEDAVRTALQVAGALEAAHAKKILHRDLKPGNILMSPAGVKLLDFGLARLFSESEATQTLGIAGTPVYMSPEQAEGEMLDARSDVFSFGSVLYELLAGRRAFDSLACVLRDDPKPLDAPVALAGIVMRCLRKKPAERFASVADLRAALESLATQPTSLQPSIAVLPFANLSSDKENEYFSDGLAEEILNALTTVPELRVVARASTFSFRGRENAIREIGETLKVSNVLHGSVRRSGNRIRVSAQLINVTDESQLWSERYDREMRDVFDIQDEIALAIVGKLKIHLGTKSAQRLVKRYTENPEVHNLYLRGIFHFSHLFSRPGELEKAKANLEKVVAAEPGHAPAWVHLADCHIARCFMGLAQPKELWPEAREAAECAVRADPEFAEGQAALGVISAWSEFSWVEAVNRVDTAVRLNPASARAHMWRSQVLLPLGRTRESLESALRAVEIDPLFGLYRLIAIDRLLVRSEYGRAAEQAQELLGLDPDHASAQCALGYAYSRMGQLEEGVRWLEKGVVARGAGEIRTASMSMAYVAAGRRADAMRFVAGIEEQRLWHPVPAATIALAKLGLGDLAGALRWFEQAIEDRDPNLSYLVGSPDFTPLRTDSRAQALLKKMNLPEAAQ